MSVWLEEWAPNAQEIEQLLAWCALVHVASSPAEAWPLNDPRERTR